MARLLWLLAAALLVAATTAEEELPENDGEVGEEAGVGINCEDGLIIPIWKGHEDMGMGDRFGRGLLYIALMIYLFIGVAIASDKFMESIEMITAQEKEVSIKDPKTGKTQTIVVKVWNETVANLTLMALGSSAPEIMLSVIEIFAKDFRAGDLGPGTIVGSAAFNLFMIIGLCMYVIPDDEVRKIKHLRVFCVTATWSVFAYVWLYLILGAISYGKVEVAGDGTAKKRSAGGLLLRLGPGLGPGLGHSPLLSKLRAGPLCGLQEQKLRHEGESVEESNTDKALREPWRCCEKQPGQ